MQKCHEIAAKFLEKSYDFMGIVMLLDCDQSIAHRFLKGESIHLHPWQVGEIAKVLKSPPEMIADIYGVRAPKSLHITEVLPKKHKDSAGKGHCREIKMKTAEKKVLTFSKGSVKDILAQCEETEVG